MTHKTACVESMQDPAEGLGEIIRRVHDPRAMFENNPILIFPVLNGQVLNLDVSGMLSGMTGIDNFDGGFIINEEMSRACLAKPSSCRTERR